MIASSHFPVGLECQWHTKAPDSLSPQLSDWLFDANSLTARLKRRCGTFTVNVLGQHVEPCSAAEATPEIIAGQAVLVREVLLYCDEQPQIFARSLLPLNSLTGEQEKLANLGEQPLGQVLFNNPSLQRQQFEIAHFDSNSSVAVLCQYLNLPCNQRLWGRRSLFSIESKPVLVAEVFLPNAYAYRDTK